jgi:hypothetical protein
MRANPESTELLRFCGKAAAIRNHTSAGTACLVLLCFFLLAHFPPSTNQTLTCKSSPSCMPNISRLRNIFPVLAVHSDKLNHVNHVNACAMSRGRAEFGPTSAPSMDAPLLVMGVFISPKQIPKYISELGHPKMRTELWCAMYRVAQNSLSSLPLRRTPPCS